MVARGPVVKRNFMVRDVSELQKTIKEAFAIANAGRKGPVLIDIPKNVQIDEWEYDENMEEPCMERRAEIREKQHFGSPSR